MPSVSFLNIFIFIIYLFFIYLLFIIIILYSYIIRIRSYSKDKNKIYTLLIGPEQELAVSKAVSHAETVKTTFNTFLLSKVNLTGDQTGS